MKTVALIALLTLVVAKSYALTPEEQNKIITTDQTRWASIKTGNYFYAAPPATWKRVQDPDLHFSVYFPCDPKRTVDDAIQYACVYNKISYGIIVTRGDFRNPLNRQYHAAGQSYQMQKRLLDSYGAPVTITPIIGMNYAGTTGRQEIIISPKLTAETRILYNNSLCVDMVIGAATGKLPNDHMIFFNTLQFDN
jgi:hypothetical protein